MIAGKDPETAGIIWDRFVKTKFSRKISDRIFDPASRAGFSVGVFSREIIAECIVHFLQFP